MRLSCAMLCCFRTMVLGSFYVFKIDFWNWLSCQQLWKCGLWQHRSWTNVDVSLMRYCDTWEQFHTDCPSYYSEWWVWKWYFYNYCHIWTQASLGLDELTLYVQGPSQLGLTRSISWLLMPWLLASPGHQQPWYWLCRISRSLSYSRRNFNCVLLVWRNDIKCKYMFTFSLKKIARKGLTLTLHESCL